MLLYSFWISLHGSAVNNIYVVIKMRILNADSTKNCDITILQRPERESLCVSGGVGWHQEG